MTIEQVRPVRVPIETRLSRRCKVDPITGCWEWQGAIAENGYGRITIDGRTAYTHRASWELANGRAVPEGLVIDHLCENRRCFNPNHLEPVTVGENNKRRQNAPGTRTHCPSGHRYAGLNLRIHVDKRGYRRRICVSCQNRRNAERLESH